MTNDEIEQADDPRAVAPRMPDFQALAKLFPTDPLVALDDDGWYLSATELDEADDTLSSGALRDAVDRLVDEVNGVAMLLRSGDRVTIGAVRPEYRYQGHRSTGTSVRITSVVAFTTSTDHLDPASASKVRDLCAAEPWVDRVVGLLAHLQRDWLWIDLWRIWDIVGSLFPATSGRRPIDKAAFRAWLATVDPTFEALAYDFENAANNPFLGNDRRHAQRNYQPMPSGRNLNKMTPDEAVRFIKRVVVAWIEKEYGETLAPQFQK